MSVLTVCPGRFGRNKHHQPIDTKEPHEPVEEEGWGIIELLLPHQGQKVRHFHICKHCGAIYSEPLE